MVEGCIFCAIVGGNAAAVVVDEDEQTLAFMDINPWATGHVLVVPRRHAVDLLDIDPDDLVAVMAGAQRMARRIEERLAPSGVTLFHSTGADAGQQVMHLHVHVVPDVVSPENAMPRHDVSADELATTAGVLRA
jgi:histidine triad (HIT) family protein